MHLTHCETWTCKNTFKCPGSYCLPVHMVCDGDSDCEHGEDEALCANNTQGYITIQ